MKPKRSSKEQQTELFIPQLLEVINADHAMVKLSHSIDWDSLEKAFEKFYCQDNGRVAISSRLMISLHYLKYTYDLSDEALLQSWVENPYWQYFSGYTTFQFKFPIDSSSLTRWRERITDVGAKSLLDETISAGLKLNQIKAKDLAHVNVDTTVQEKFIRYPTDARLYSRATEKLVKAAKKRKLVLRQTYERTTVRLLYYYSNYSHRRKFKEAAQCLRKLKRNLGRVIRDVENKCVKMDNGLRTLLSIAKKIFEQKRDDSNKIYSVHEPLVSCISKGKQHKKYEFGNKVGFSVTSKSNWILSAVSFSTPVHDSKTLAATVEQIPERISGSIKNMYVDGGYRGASLAIAAKLHIDSNKKREIPRQIWKWMKRRARIEPTIGHMKTEYRLTRNKLKGTMGDSINAILSAAAYNFKKLLKAFCFFIFWTTFLFKTKKMGHAIQYG